MNQGDNNKMTLGPNGEINVQSDDSQEGLIFDQNGTYCRVGSADGGMLEIDLRSIKQKGTEERYLSLKVVGFDEQQQVATSEMMLLNEELFKKLKEFLSKLNWND